MLLGTGLIVGGAVMFGTALASSVANRCKVESNKDNCDQYTAAYTKLLTNIGVMDVTSGDWIKYVSRNDTECYRQISFKISDTLTVKAIRDKREVIAEKMHVDNLEVIAAKGLITFKTMKEGAKPVTYKFVPTEKHIITLATDYDNKVVEWDLKADPHLLVGGTNNCGKSSLLNMIINHIMRNEAGKLWLIDLKDGLEFGDYMGCSQVERYSETIAQARKMIVEFLNESIRRYHFLRDRGFKNYNKYVESLKDGEIDELGRIFLIMDEFADMMQGKDDTTIQDLITLSRKCRAVGMVMILATQKPTADAVPTALAANMTARVGFRVTNSTNSITIIGEKGCEDLKNFECIGILKGYKLRFRTMFLEDKTIMDTIKKYKVHKDLTVEVPREQGMINK